MIPLSTTAPSRTRTATAILVGASAAVFLYQVSLGRSGFEDLVRPLAIVPTRVLEGDLVPIVTYMFVHAGVLHIAANMLYLWVFGRAVEGTLGSARYVALYLGCGVLSALVHVAVHPRSELPTVGASGAISGVLGAFLVLHPRARVLTLVPILVVPWLVEIPALVFLVLWFVLQLFAGVASLGATTQVAWWAHAGGFAAGVLGASLLRPRGLPEERGAPTTTT